VKPVLTLLLETKPDSTANNVPDTRQSIQRKKYQVSSQICVEIVFILLDEILPHDGCSAFVSHVPLPDECLSNTRPTNGKPCETAPHISPSPNH